MFGYAVVMASTSGRAANDIAANLRLSRVSNRDLHLLQLTAFNIENEPAHL